MTDLSALTAETSRRIDGFQAWALDASGNRDAEWSITRYEAACLLAAHRLALDLCASERDQAVREADSWQEVAEVYKTSTAAYRRDADRLAAALDGVLDATENNNELSCEQRVRKAHQIAYDALAASQDAALSALEGTTDG